MQPTTLQEAIQYFSNEEVCLQSVAAMQRSEGVACPQFQVKTVFYLKGRHVWPCKGCRKQFSMKIGTIFEDSPIKLNPWLCAMWLLINGENGISSYEVACSLGVTQETAWCVMHRFDWGCSKGHGLGAVQRSGSRWNLISAG